MLKQPERYKARSKENWKTRLLRFLLPAMYISLFILLANFVVRYLWVYPVRMMAGNMTPAIRPGGVFFLEEKKIDTVEHRQIVRVDHPLGGRLYCRVVAREGETVAMKDGIVYVAEQAVSLPGVTSPQPLFPPEMSQRDNFSPLTLRPGFFFCLNDNRSYLNDSRTLGAMELRHITGIVKFAGWLGSKT